MVAFKVPVFKRDPSLCSPRLCIYVIQALVLHVCWPSVTAEVLGVMRTTTSLHRLHLRVARSVAWCVMASVESCRLVDQVLLAFHQGAHWQEQLVVRLVRLRDGCA